MPVRIGTLLKNLADKIGVPTDTPDFIDLLSANLEVPDAVAQAFAVDVLTFQAAQNHPKLKSHYYATSLNEVDRRLTSNMDELEFPDTAKSDVMAAQSTFERINLFAKKIKELTAAKEGTTGKEKNELTTQINTLQRQMADAAQSARQLLDNANVAHQQEMADMYLSSRIAARKLDTSVYPDDVMQTIARNYIERAFQEKGIKPVYSNKSVSLKQSQSPDLDFYHNNQPYTLDHLIDEVLAANKLITVNDPAGKQGNGGSQQQQQRQQQQQNNNQNNGNAVTQLSGMLGKLDKLQADFKTGATN